MSNSLLILNLGPEAYFTDLFYRDRELVRDTERCLQKGSEDVWHVGFCQA